MSKHKHKKKQGKPKSEWSDRRWRKVVQGSCTILKLAKHQYFTPEGVIMSQHPTQVSPPPFSLWDALGFKHEATPGTPPGTWEHTFTDRRITPAGIDAHFEWWKKETEATLKEQEEDKDE